VSQVRRFSPWVLGVLAAAPLASAFGQNLDAGKPASQIFAEACANCHRSPRQLRSNAGASFLREHHTTGSGMASNLAAYLSSAGSDPRAAGAPQPKRPPNPGAAAPAATTTARDTPATDISRILPGECNRRAPAPREQKQRPKPNPNPLPRRRRLLRPYLRGQRSRNLKNRKSWDGHAQVRGRPRNETDRAANPLMRARLVGEFFNVH